jgi:uncharacterized protein YydD (DUF2326 family)
MLIQLYSETDLLLKPIRFEPGINLILGKYTGEKEQTGINGIGKSSLVRLIDFALLSNAAEKIFSQSKYDFLREEKHNIALEFRVENKSYYIKRTFGKGDDVLFGDSPSNLEKYSKTELKSLLTNKFFPIINQEVYFEGERYGTLMDFYIKDDLENQERVDPLSFSSGTSNQTSKAIFNFFLLGLPTRFIIQFEELQAEYNQFKSTITGLEDKLMADYGKSVEEYRSERSKIDKNISLLEKSIKDYRFLENYKNIETKLVEITTQINEKLKNYHIHNRKLKKIKESFQFAQEIDLQQIKKMYNEMIATFGDLVSKSIEEIALFKKEILENRNKFLIKKESELQNTINSILSEISSLEDERSALYKKLEEKGALESISNTYEQLTVEKTRLTENLQIIKQVDELQEMLGNLNVSISQVKRDIALDLKKYEDEVEKLRTLFLEILQNAISLDENETTGFFDIASNVDSPRNQLPLKIEIKIPKADALGQSRLKIVAYDLLVFLKNIRSNSPFPRFLIHDGVYHGIALNTKIKALNYIYRQYLANPTFQYFVTFNEDEIYIPKEKASIVGSFEFDIENIKIAEFTDNPLGMLFKRDFK